MDLTKGKIPSVILLLVTAIWGTSFVAMNSALDIGYNRFFILLIRFLIAIILLLIVFNKKLIKSIDQMCLIRGTILGVVFFLAFTGQITGLDLTTPAKNSMITSGDVVFVPFVAWALTKVKPLKKNFLATAVCFIGVFIISVDFSEGLSFQIGDLFSLGGSILFAVQLTLLSLMGRESEYRGLLFVQFVVSAILSFVTFMITDGDFSVYNNVTGWLDLAYLGIVCTFICFLLEGWALKYTGPTVGAVIMATECVFASIFSLIVGMDQLTWQLVVGGILMFSALIIQEIKLKDKKIKVGNTVC